MYQVGQKLWFVPINIRRGGPKEVTIEKIGRKWITFDDNSRADIKTLIVDGGDWMSPGRCYASLDEFERETAIREAWEKFRGHVYEQRKAPPGVDAETIDRVRELLGLKDRHANPPAIPNRV